MVLTSLMQYPFSQIAIRLAITIPDKRFDEERFVTIDVDAFGRVLVVVYTLRDEEIRLISARKAIVKNDSSTRRNSHGSGI
jgi:uncharacterized DUF497 family protein